ncbi:unnamed protein product [Tilletia caries]|uniref:RanBP2-type domain-containing protein n=1 Tax=Tilletia caries TaxID=13290 RepID=A0ABN7J214_9BASI|nr:unnamed protein product [Tilletia caries]
MDNHNTSSSESPKSPQTSNDVSTVDGATEAKKQELSKSPSASSRSPQRSYDSPIEHQRTSAASNAVKAAAKAAAASVQSFDAGSGGSASSGDRKEGIVIGRKDAVELLQSNVFTQSPPPSATLSSSEHNQPGAGESINRTMDGAKKAEDDKGPGSNAAQHPAGEQKEGTASGYALLGRSLDTGATMVPPHLLWRQGAEGEFSSNAPTREGVTKSHGSAWSSMAAASGIGEHDAVRSREQSGRSVASVLSAASLGSPPSQGHGLLGAEFRTGDWVCVSDTCSFHNFAQNLTCLGCGAAKPVGTCGDNPPQRNQQQGARDHSKNDAGSPLSSSSISASTATAGSSGLGPANSSGLTTKQIQELMAQHRVKTETGSKHQQNLSASSAATSAAGVAASQWAPGGTLSSATENNTATSQQGGRGNGSYFTSQAGAAPTGGSGIRYGGTNNYGAYGSYTGGTSTPPSQANMAALEAFRASAGTPGLGMNPYQQNPLAQYLPIQAQIQAQAHAQAQAQAQQGQGQGQGQRGGSAYGGMAPNMSLYQLQLQHAAMKNQNGMPLAQSSGPLARMQALTSAFGGMPSANQNQSQGSMPAYGQSYTNMNAGSSAGGPIRYGQQSQHSAHSSLSATTASFNHNGLSSHLPISTSSTPSYGAQVSSGYPMQHFTGSSQGQNQSQGQAQLPPLDWSNFGKSSANVPYPTAAPYRSAHMQNQSTLNTSLPSSTPAMSSTTSMSTSVSTAYNDSASASVGVGLNLPGGVEGLAIKQPWLSTAPSNAATAARLANLGIGIGPGVNPNVGGPDPVSEKRKATAGNNEDASADGGSSNPPIVNTGNSGPMCVQPGDWVCSGCGFVNWRRRRVCLRCFPFAEGNETAASLANGAILAAQLAAGVSPSKVDTASLLKSPSRGRETRSREQSAPGATGYEYQSGQMATTPIVGLGLNLGPSNQQGFGSPMPRYPGTAGTPAFGANALAPLPTSSSQPTLLLNPFDSAPPTRRTSPKESPALANPVPNWASASHADRMGMDSRISPPAGFAQDWQRRAAGGGPGAGRTVSGPVLPTTRAPGGPTTASMHSITSHMRQTSFNSAPSVPESEILGSGSTSSSAWYASPVGSGAAIFTPSTTRTNSGSSTTMSAGAGQGSTAGAGAAASAGMSASTRNIWGTSPPRKIGANKLVDEDNREVGNGAVRGSIGAVSRPVGFRNSGSSSVDSYDHGSHGNNNATSPT